MFRAEEESLAKLVLAELPFQLLEFMTAKQILPKASKAGGNDP